MIAWALQRKFNSRSELEIPKITLQLAGRSALDLRAEVGVVHGDVTI
jgi:hypothetical protein